MNTHTFIKVLNKLRTSGYLCAHATEIKLAFVYLLINQINKSVGSKLSKAISHVD